MLFNPKHILPQDHLVLVTGRNLAHSKRSASQRAGVAAQLVLGEADLVNPTVTQVVVLLKVSVPYVEAALAGTADERRELAEGRLTISELHPPISVELAKIWRNASARDRLEFARRVGAEEVWADAVSPAIG
jgi:hypothetical protein